jgi:hypothetical protein
MDTGNKTWYGNAAGPHPSLQGRGSLCGSGLFVCWRNVVDYIACNLCVLDRSFLF